MKTRNKIYNYCHLILIFSFVSVFSKFIPFKELYVFKSFIHVLKRQLMNIKDGENQENKFKVQI